MKSIILQEEFDYLIIEIPNNILYTFIIYRYSYGSSKRSKALLLMSLFPVWPQNSEDNRLILPITNPNKLTYSH